MCHRLLQPLALGSKSVEQEAVVCGPMGRMEFHLRQLLVLELLLFLLRQLHWRALLMLRLLLWMLLLLLLLLLLVAEPAAAAAVVVIGAVAGVPCLSGSRRQQAKM